MIFLWNSFNGTVLNITECIPQEPLHNSDYWTNTFFSFFTEPMSLYTWLPTENDVIPANKYMPKVKNRDTRKKFEICSKLTIKIAVRRYWHLSNFENILYLFLVFLLLTLNRWTFAMVRRIMLISDCLQKTCHKGFLEMSEFQKDATSKELQE